MENFPHILVIFSETFHKSKHYLSKNISSNEERIIKSQEYIKTLKSWLDIGKR